ncbi:MAG: pseudouridine synthase, partial [Caulobacteraceae bacterium]|nr:pseudouridine synthase [Caulobacteraceae bacterium]
MEELDPDALDPGLRVLEVSADEAGERLDKVLAGKLTDLSRVGVQRLIGQGMVSLGGVAQRDASAKAQAGLYRLTIPAPEPAIPQPEAIVLTVLFEDQHLIVIDKPAGLAAHPAPGTLTGTLVNALLRHCGDSLSGFGWVSRRGFVHRLDKLTSGVMVAA